MKWLQLMTLNPNLQQVSRAEVTDHNKVDARLCRKNLHQGIFNEIKYWIFNCPRMGKTGYLDKINPEQLVLVILTVITCFQGIKPFPRISLCLLFKRASQITKL